MESPKFGIFQGTHRAHSVREGVPITILYNKKSSASNCIKDVAEKGGRYGKLSRPELYYGRNHINGKRRKELHPRTTHLRLFCRNRKMIRTTVPQLFMDCMEQFEERLVVEFETYLNGQKIHHDQIAEAIGDILKKSIGDAMKNLKITL